MKSGKIGDYSEFEEEEEVDLQNLIGSRSVRPVSGSTAKPTAEPATTRGAAARRGDDDDFDSDF